MKNKQIITILCTVLALTATGCQSSEADFDTEAVGVVDFNNETDREEHTVTEQDNVLQDTDNMQAPSDISKTNTDNAQSQQDTELDGVIESIGDNSVVVNKTVIVSEEEAVMALDSKELVSVSFDAETTFEVWTVKNGGVNGDTDIEKQQGTFSDLEINIDLHMTGSYEGDVFHAKQVVIYHFV